MPPDSSAPAPRPRRRRLRVSLRGLMALVLVAGGGLGWQVHRVRTQREAVAAIRAAGGNVGYDFQFTDSEWMMRNPAAEPPAPRWLRRWLGDDWFQTTVTVGMPEVTSPEFLAAIGRLGDLRTLFLSDAGTAGDGWPALTKLTRLEAVHLSGAGVSGSAMAALASIPSLRSVSLFNAPVTDEQFAPLAGLPALRTLSLTNCRALTDEGMARMLSRTQSSLEGAHLSEHPGPLRETARALGRHHPNLTQLGLRDSPIVDADLVSLGDLARLEVLDLGRTAVTDAGTDHLARLQQLKSLNISFTGITDGGLKAVGLLRSLTDLDLSFTGIGDGGLPELRGLGRLKELFLLDTAATPRGVAALQATMPRTTIGHSTRNRPRTTPTSSR